MCRVHQTVKYGVGNGFLTDYIMPGLNWKLCSYYCRFFVPVFDYLHKGVYSTHRRRYVTPALLNSLSKSGKLGFQCYELFAFRLLVGREDFVEFLQGQYPNLIRGKVVTLKKFNEFGHRIAREAQ